MANLAELIPAFFTGPGGQRLTPDQIAERQQIAQSLLAQATDTSPNAGGVASILAKGLQGFQAGRNRISADKAAGANASSSQSNIQKMIGSLTGGSTAPVGQAATVASPMVGGGPSASVPQTADASYIRSGLIERGLPEHVADGFLVNFQDESGLNPGINEANPIVPGSRGGFGLYQLTGPRRVAYEQFASQKGVDPSNVDAQLDFLMQEGQGSERGAFEKILAAPDTATAAQTIVNDFLRPSPEHAQSRASRYAGLGGGVQPVSQDMGIAAALGEGGFPAAPSAPTQQGINPTVIEALSSPYASPEERNMAGILLNQQMGQQQTAQKQALAEQQRAQEIARRTAIAQQNGINPTFAQDDELWKGATGNLFAAPSTSTLGNTIIDNRTGQPIYQGEPERQPLMNLGDGTVYDPNAPQDQRFIQAPNGSRGFRQASPDEIKVYGTNGQVGPDGKFYPITPPQGTALSVDPNTGAVTFNQGAGVKPLTEGQSKDSFFTTRMTAALPTLEANETALLNLGETVAGAAPMNLGNYAQSEEYQLARDAGRDFVTAYLRKDSGAALTPSEEKIYGELLLPQPGDKPATIALKKQRRQVAVEAIKSGMPPQAIDGVIKAIDSVPGADQATVPTDIPGVTIRRKN